MQWGKGKSFPDNLVKVYFPIPFPHKVFIVNTTSQNDDLTGSNQDNSSPIIGTNTTNNYFTANTDGFPEMRREDVFYWFAIGY